MFWVAEYEYDEWFYLGVGNGSAQAATEPLLFLNSFGRLVWLGSGLSFCNLFELSSVWFEAFQTASLAQAS